MIVAGYLQRGRRPGQGGRVSSRQVGATVALAAAVALAPGPALAHSTLTGSDPALGAVLATAPSSVRLVFDEPLSRNGVVTVTGPDRVQRQHGPARIDGTTVVQDLEPLAAAGGYRVAYRLASQGDGHPVIGATHFDLAVSGVARSADAAAGPAAHAGSPSGSGVLLAGAAVLVLASAAAVRRRSSRT